ncbi:hypothetical protein IKU74_06350 [bacterium]|nr:hypothetical protein [bacterium]
MALIEILGTNNNAVGKKGEDNTIIGNENNNNLKGADKNDEITGGLGVDTITGGSGLTTINYKKGDGNDIIYLTKGEDLLLKFEKGSEIVSLDSLRYKYTNNNKDLLIYTSKSSDDEYITLKNFGIKDITNSVKIQVGTSSPLDLKSVQIVTDDVVKNFTGTWLDDKASALSYTVFDRNGVEVLTNTKGLTISGKLGDDHLTGTKYNDKIYGDEGNDTIKAGLGNDVIYGGDGDDIIHGEAGDDIITGGLGANTVYLKHNYGNDTVYLTKGENLTLEISNTEYSFGYGDSTKDVRIYTTADKDEYVTLKGLGAKDVTNNSNAKKGIEDTSSVIFKVLPYTSLEVREQYIDTIFSDDVVKKSFTGTWLNDNIDASNAPLVSAKNNKGLTLKGAGGNDIIVGSKYNDTITGGVGENLIKYTKGNGNDIINLTKGENFTLSIDGDGISDIDDLNFEFAKKDLRIYTAEGEYLTIKNFVAKDVTNNGNAKKGIDDTSSVELKIGSETYDLREYFYNVNPTKNYTGSWLNEQIIGLGYKKYDKKGLLITDNAQKGLSLNGKDGDDFIVGSIYSDTIKGGNGSDLIVGGTGNDKLYGEAGKNIFVFNVGDGADTIYSGKGEDSIEINGVNSIESIEQIYSKGKGTKDAIISYGSNGDSITIKDFYLIDKKGNITGIKSSVQNITIEDCKFNFITGKGTISGTEESNIILGSEKEHIITGDKGNDIIFGGEVKNTYIFNSGDGTDIINYKGGNDVIKFTDVEITDIAFSNYDLENQTFTMSYGTSDKITVKGLSTDRNSVKIEDSTGTQYTIFVGDGDKNNDTVQKPNVGENAVFISSTGKDRFEGNTGINVFTNCNNSDSNIGSNYGTNIFLITPEQSVNLYAQGQNDKIIFKDLELSDLVYTFPTDSVGKVVITNINNSQRIELMNFATSNVNPTILDKNGDTTTVCDELGIILDDVGTSGDDIILSSKKDAEVYGKGGSDYINVSADNITVYTYDKDLKNTTEGSSVIVKTNHNYKYTIYAQSEENIILNQAYRAKGTYYAYSDQKTSITESDNQKASTDSVLNIMNTNDESDKDGVHSDLSIVFNVDKGYTATSGVGNVGDVHIVDATNLSAWVNGNDFKGITIKNNVVETINSADGYSITSTQIAQLAETVATWLSSKGYNDVQAVLDGGITDDINALTTYFAQDSNWTAMP